jgi:hypothetical protein
LLWQPVPTPAGEENQSVRTLELLIRRETGMHDAAPLHACQVGMIPTAICPAGQVTDVAVRLPFVLVPATKGPVTYVHPDVENVPAGPCGP